MKTRDFEQEIAGLEREMASIQTQMDEETDWSVYEMKLQQLQKLQQVLNQCYEEWIQYQE
ncbi:hypothetical protein D3C80_1967380 [compost metagenome]